MDGFAIFEFGEPGDIVPPSSDEANEAEPVLPEAYTTYASEPIHEEFLGFGKYATKHMNHPHHYHFLNHGSPTAEDWEIDEEKSEAAYAIHSFSSLALLSLSEGGHRSIPRLRQEMINILAGLRDAHEARIDHESWVSGSKPQDIPNLVPSSAKRISYNVYGEMSEDQVDAFQREAKKNFSGTISLSLVPPEGKRAARARKHARGIFAELVPPVAASCPVVLTEEEQQDRYQNDEEAGASRDAMETNEAAARTGEETTSDGFSAADRSRFVSRGHSLQLGIRRTDRD